MLPRIAFHLTTPWRRAATLTAILLSTANAALHAQTAAAPAKAPAGIRFCAYNLKNWLEMDRRFNASPSAPGPQKPKPDKEKAKVIEFLREINPDILGVSEIGNGKDLADFVQHLSDAGMTFPYIESCHGGDPVRQLALLSKYPVTAKNHQTDLRYRLGELTLPVQRGFLDATLQLAPGFQLRCIGVHLKSQREVTEADQALMRRNEAHLLRQRVTTILEADPETRLLLYGDFNDNPKSPAIDELHGDRAQPDTKMTDIYLHDAEGEIWTHFYDWEDSYSRLDYFFVSPALQPFVNTKNSFIYRAKDFLTASDHRPIVLDLSVTTSKSRKKKAAK